MTQPTAPIPVQPVIQYPKLAETGKTYVMRVDLQPLCTANDWPYEAEEYPVYCMVDASPLFECRPIGEPVVIVHRFGGTYGPATFLLTASRQPSNGVIKLHLFSGSGIPISMLELNGVSVLAQVARQAPRSREEESADTAEPVISEAPTVTPSPDNAKALRAYGQKLISIYDHLPLGRIAVLSTEKGTENQVRLAVVYIAPDTTELIRADLDQHWYDPELMKHISALRTVVLNQRVALLGAPGSGKSTFLRYLTLGLASELVGSPVDQQVQLLEWQLRANVPILVNLCNLAAWFASIDRSNSGSQAGPGLIWQFISSELVAWGLGVAIEPLHSILVEGRAVVMFDEMDSAGDQIARVRKAITEFANHYSKNHYVVTCRTLFYQAAEQQLHRFAVAELAPFSGVQVDHFISAWYAELAHLGILSSSDQQQTAEVVKKALRHPGLSQLAHNPLTLTMMVLFHSYRSELPTHRTLLYEELVDLMLWHWERLKTDATPDAMPSLLGMLHQVGRSEIDLKRVLWKLAFGACAQAIEQGKDGIEESYLLKALSTLSSGDLGWAQQTLDTMKLRSSLLVEIRPRVFSFAHKAIQEYLAGSLLVAAQADFVRQSARLAVKDVRWHEVVLLAIEKMADLNTDLENLLVLTDELCPIKTIDEELSWRTALLAGGALLVVDPNRASNLELGPELSERVRHRLSELVTLGRLEPSERARAGDSLGRLGDPRPGVGLRADGLPDIAWCDVPAGDFIMGSAKQTDSMAQDDEAPQHLERIPTHYYISKYPITNAQFDAFVRDGGYTDRWQHCWTVEGWRWKGDRTAPQKQGGVFDLPNHPVTMITWYEALSFCNWLGEKLGVTVSLPSEAQWERAGRGTDGRRYPWGDQLTPDHTNCAETGIGTTTAVGIFPKGANPEAGVLDMGGNVWEWCRTKWRDGYPSTPDDDIAGEGARVARGGSYISLDNELRCAFRRSSSPDSPSPDCGFRIVSTPAIQSDFSGYSPTELRSRFLREGDAQIRRQLYDRLAQDPGSHRFLLNQHALRMTEAIEPTAEELRRSAEIIEELRTKLSRVKEIAGPYAETIMFGSFARGTAIRPLSDIDALVAFRFNPQLEKPETSYKILDIVLRRIYKTQVVERKWTDKGRNVPGSSFGASILVHLPDMWLEITPAVYSRSDREKLLVPEHNLRRWVPTNHEIHAAFTRDQDAKTGGAYTALTKAVKWWHFHNVPWSRYLTGFMLECLVAADGAPTDGALLEAFREFLARVRGKYTSPSQLRRIPELGVQSGYKLTNLSEANYRRLMALIDKTLDTIAQTDKMRDIGDKVAIWRSVLGAEFPETLT